jgi:hypothetical protein
LAGLQNITTTHVFAATIVTGQCNVGA